MNVNDNNKKRYGLIGARLGHSYSKIIHEKLGYPYDLIELDESELDAFFAARDFTGINVTIPYKKAVIKYCDEVSDIAGRIGAVNTLYFDETHALIGTNTDYAGLKYALERANISLRNKKVLILGGSGGAGQMACVLAADEGASRICVASRKTVKHNKTTDGTREEEASEKNRPEGNCTHALQYCTYEELPYDAEIIINATPVGTYPNIYDSPIDLSAFPGCEGVCDLIYNPLRTTLLSQARDLGIRYTNGLPMLVRQATEAAEYFHVSRGDHASATDKDRTTFTERTEEILKELERDTENIVLIGMPGCGKTSIGKMLASKSGRTLIDTDTYIKEKTGQTAANIIKERGEQTFRDIETEAVKELSKEHSLIIATGGGVPIRPENISALKQNGRIYFLDRDPDKLSTYGRPLSQNGGVYKLYEERYDIYKSVCDERIENNQDDFSPAADIIVKLRCLF